MLNVFRLLIMERTDHAVYFVDRNRIDPVGLPNR